MDDIIKKNTHVTKECFVKLEDVFQSNPWSVKNASTFLNYCCPECGIRFLNCQKFIDHAKKKHARSIVLFGYKNDLPKKENPVYSSIGDDKIFYNTIKKICNTNVRKECYVKLEDFFENNPWSVESASAFLKTEDFTNISYQKFSENAKKNHTRSIVLFGYNEKKLLKEDISQKRKKNVFELEVNDKSNKKAKNGNADTVDKMPILSPKSNNITKNGNVELEYYTLNTGGKIPIVQFGTYKMKGEECYQGVLSALKMGYKGLDTASIYCNEGEVGRALVESGVNRKEVFVQTKLWRSFVGKDPKNGKPRCDSELRKSLRKLGLKYIDLWLVHWPGPGRHLNYPPVKEGMNRPKVVLDKNKDKMAPVDWSPSMRLSTWSDMVANVGPAGSQKPLRAAGVCNFSERQLQELLSYCRDNNLQKPAVVQNECHPLLQARGVRSLCEKEGIVFQAYASLGAGHLGLCQDPVVMGVARQVGMSPGQVLLRWAVQGGCAVLPKSAKDERRIENMDVLEWKLGKEEMKELDNMEKAAAGQNTMVGWLREHDPDFY